VNGPFPDVRRYYRHDEQKDNRPLGPRPFERCGRHSFETVPE